MYKKVKKVLTEGRCLGSAEIIVYHAQKGPKADQVKVFLSDERVSFMIEEPMKRKWPVILHIEFASLDGGNRNSYLKTFRNLLNTYPNHPFVLMHMGQLDFSNVEKLLANNQNIYFMISHCDPVTV